MKPAIGLYHAIMVFYDAFYNGKAYSRSGVFCFIIQLLKDIEDLVSELLFEADPIISDVDMTTRCGSR